MELDELITRSVKHNATDLHLCCGDFPRWRRVGQLEVIPASVRLSQEWFDLFCRRYLPTSQKQQLTQDGQCEFALTLGGKTRLRLSLFQQQQGMSLAIRLIATHLPSLQQLHLPESVQTIMQCTHGLILLSGATGCGKSTTLATVIETINHQQSRHIITLEDPIEYCHHSQSSLIQQREIGQHVADFFSGIKAALRQDPDIILLGELRDVATIQLALSAAETGHLVFATLHTASAVEALQRLVDMFPGKERDLIQSQLAHSLQLVIAQQLIFEHQVCSPLFEVLVNTSATAHLIREGKFHQLPAVMEMSLEQGMQTFEQARQQRMTSNPANAAERPLTTTSAEISKGFQTNFPQ